MQVLIKPLITEKMTSESEKRNRVGFIVDESANKVQIRTAVEEASNVAVEGVNTMNYAGKSKTRYTRTSVTKGRTAAFKKAIVTLAEGDEIDFYSNI